MVNNPNWFVKIKSSKAILKTSALVIWSVVVFAIGTYYGPGIKYKSQEVEIQRTQQILNIRQQLDPVYRQILLLVREYQSIAVPDALFVDTADGKWVDTPGSEWLRISEETKTKMFVLQKRLDLLLENFQTLEDRLAALEDREPKNMPLEFIPKKYRKQG
jgi:hypothetical protein